MVIDPGPVQLLSKTKNFIGEERIVAECSGINYTVQVTESRLVVEKRFARGDAIVNVPYTSVSTLELITKSPLPPITIVVLSAPATLLVWWFLGLGTVPPPFPLDIVTLGLGIVCFGASVSLVWRRRVAALRIGIDGFEGAITVKFVSSSSAESVFRALRG